MDRFVYIAAAGARQTQLAQAVNAHNLANASTTGFKQDLISAETLYVNGSGQSTRAYNMVTGSAADLGQGTLQQTGRDLDIAINGPGWFVFQGEGGVEGLTRRGDLRIDEFGQLVNGAGQIMMGEAGPVALPPFSNITIGSDGTVSIVPLGEAPNAVAVLDRLKLVNPPESIIRKDSAGELQTIDGEPLFSDATLRLVTGTLEASNVNSISAMVRMIELSREFEQHMKMVQVGEELDTSSASLMRMQT
ncbi:MAG: flagellar basal body rod protein FlgF [Pseudomonadota bacterium]